MPSAATGDAVAAALQASSRETSARPRSPRDVIRALLRPLQGRWSRMIGCARRPVNAAWNARQRIRQALPAPRKRLRLEAVDPALEVGQLVLRLAGEQVDEATLDA